MINPTRPQEPEKNDEICRCFLDKDSSVQPKVSYLSAASKIKVKNTKLIRLSGFKTNHNTHKKNNNNTLEEAGPLNLHGALEQDCIFPFLALHRKHHELLSTNTIDDSSLYPAAHLQPHSCWIDFRSIP